MFALILIERGWSTWPLIPARSRQQSDQPGNVGGDPVLEPPRLTGDEPSLANERDLCYPPGSNFIRRSGTTVALALMRLLLARSLILLLSLALANGNAHAALHLTAAPFEPCPEEHAHHTGNISPHHRHQHDNGVACCCDCLGCTSAAYPSPQLSVTPAELAAQIHYDALAAFLSGRTVRPEPDPPRPFALS